MFTHTCPAPPPAAAVVAAGGCVADPADGVGAGAMAAGAVPPVSQLCTPPWPRQAPLRVLPLNEDPSLHGAVTVAWAKTGLSEAEGIMKSLLLTLALTAGFVLIRN